MPYVISKAHRLGRCKYCNEPIAKGTLKIVNVGRAGGRGKEGSLNYENAGLGVHTSCITHNLALNMCEKKNVSHDVVFFCHPDEARKVVKLVKQIAFGYNAAQL